MIYRSLKLNPVIDFHPCWQECLRSNIANNIF
jgi:hypothetical protein